MNDGCAPQNGNRSATRGPLSEQKEEDICVVVRNTDRQSMEMGLFAGARIRVVKNALESPNMVVAVNESRYMLSKDTARQIEVK